MIDTLPLFYFKPTICWIDDDQLFLDAIKLYFDESYHCMTFNNPHTAIDFLQSYQSPLSQINFTRELTESDVFGTNDHYPIDINIPYIRNLATIPARVNEIAILVIDYNMPGVSGLQLCEKFKSQPFKKILLTGDASNEKAIDAFNQGIIDRFINKDRHIVENLTQYLGELTQSYFSQKTAHLISTIETSRPSLLSDPHFVAFFNSWVNDNKVSELYLINKQGSYFVKHADGTSSYFVVMSERDKAEFLRLNDELLDQAGHLLNGMADNELIPFFGPEKESWDIHVSDWARYFYPSKIIEGRERYFWAVVTSSEYLSDKIKQHT